ncbi:hypothetical protein VIBNIWn13_710039 [Vibrio nigripulchritudo Wn13]|nr:hypothetical protein VIBNIWn13_710039 [Vibrio nigripulchritudo Wn13]
MFCLRKRRRHSCVSGFKNEGNSILYQHQEIGKEALKFFARNGNWCDDKFINLNGCRHEYVMSHRL